jgi:hypothetical protein
LSGGAKDKKDASARRDDASLATVKNQFGKCS